MLFTNSLSALVVASVLSLSAARAAQSPWVGCVLKYPVAAAAGYSATDGANTKDSCISTCASKGYPYAGWTLLPALTPACHCLSEANYISPISYVAPSTSITTTCLPTLQSSVQMFVTSSPYIFSGCYGVSSDTFGVIDPVNGTFGTTVSSPRACFDMCQNNKHAYLIPYLASNSALPHYGCACGDQTTIPGTPRPCGLGFMFAYSQSVAVRELAGGEEKRGYRSVMAEKRAEMAAEKRAERLGEA
ncbi:hypothetical protein IAT38_002308 [Cryptococcus sp. DSM 104549]